MRTNATRIVSGMLAIAGLLALAGCDEGGVTVQARTASLAAAETLIVDGRIAPNGIEKVVVTVDEVVAHFVPAGGGGARGKGAGGASWTTLSTGPATLDLMTLKDNPAVLGYGALGDGKITQIRLSVSETTPPVVTIGGVDHQMKVPSGTIKLVSPFCVSSTSETVITLDFDAEKSVTATPDGYELRPTIKVEGDGGGCEDDDGDDEAEDSDDTDDCGDTDDSDSDD